MTNPVYKIETYTAAVLDHTITTDATHIMYKESVTDSIGYFSFSVPGVKGGNKIYDDIALNDKIKIWIDYESVSGDPHFIGRVYNIDSSMTKNGYFRVISGLSQGEILLRRHKKDTLWEAATVKTVADELADDLSLGKGDIAADATVVTVEVETKTYFDLLRELSDYYVSGGSQIKKDWMVDVDYDLRFVNRGDAPFVSYAALTLEVGKNLLSYHVTQDKKPVRNNITVYGAKERTEPADIDLWTEPAGSPPAGWTSVTGTLTQEAVMFRKGTFAVKCADAGTTVDFHKDFTTRLKDYEKLTFWCRPAAIPVLNKLVRILAPDTSNYYEVSIPTFNSGVFNHNELDLGPAHIYDADSNPNGVWTATGSPRWWNMQGIEFRFVSSGSPCWLVIDGAFCLTLGRYDATVYTGASVTSYEQSDLELTDDKLHSDTECLKRANTLTYQLKDHPTQISFVSKGDSSIKSGDKRLITLPMENISAVYYYVLSTEHVFTGGGYVTNGVLMNTLNIRNPVSNSNQKVLSDLNRRVRELSQSENWRK